jgi:hypothetical protein
LEIVFGRKLEEKKPFGRLGLGERIILKWISGKLFLGMWIGFVWLMIGTGGGLL